MIKELMHDLDGIRARFLRIPCTKWAVSLLYTVYLLYRLIYDNMFHMVYIR